MASNANGADPSGMLRSTLFAKAPFKRQYGSNRTEPSFIRQSFIFKSKRL